MARSPRFRLSKQRGPSWQTFATAANALEPGLRAAFLAAVRRVRWTAGHEAALEAALAAGDLTRVTMLVLGPTPQAGYTPAQWAGLEAAVRYAGWMAATRLGAQMGMGMGVQNPMAFRALELQGAQLVAEVDAATRAGIQSYVAAQLREGANPRALIPELVGRVQPDGTRQGGIVGLTERQALAVRNYRRALEELDPDALERALRDKRFDRTVRGALEAAEPLDADYIDRAVGRYEANMLAYRAETIARTESLRALGEGQHMAWDTAIESGRVDRAELTKTWRTATDDRVRPEHAEMEGVTVLYDEDFEPEDTGPIWGPPVAINCRCICWVAPEAGGAGAEEYAAEEA